MEDRETEEDAEDDREEDSPRVLNSVLEDENGRESG